MHQLISRGFLRLNFTVEKKLSLDQYPSEIMKRFLLPLLILSTGVLASAADAPKPLKALLIAGGCCHDYAAQKDILKDGLEKRANIKVDIIYSPDTTVTPKFSFYGNPDYAKGYDVIIHDECAAGVGDQAVVEGVLKPHMDGIPGVNLHCAMHSYRIGNPGEPAIPGKPHALWFEYLGLQSSGHGDQEPIAIHYTDEASPITKGLADWTTMKEELYNNIKLLDGVTLAFGKQSVSAVSKQPDGREIKGLRTDTSTVVWTNLYKGKTRVFSTTIGHNNETVADARYLDLVTRGLLWSCDKLAEDGTPKPGYGPAPAAAK